MAKKYLDLTGLASYDSKIRILIGGKYTKPSLGIPKTDMATAVQNSLTKADAAASMTEVNAAIQAAIQNTWNGEY